MEISYTISKDDTYLNIKDLLKSRFRISDRLLLRLKNNKKILLNGEVAMASSLLKDNDNVKVLIDFEEDSSNIVPVKMDLKIIYEDLYYLILDKPAGIPVHPSILHYDNSLSNGIKYYFEKINLKKKIRPVNRLDKNTSGIVIFAKNEYIQEHLIKQMKSGEFVKEYAAICEGIFDNTNGVINYPIARKSGSIIERCVDENGDNAITHYMVLNSSNNLSVVNCIIETGRTHQIRVHMSYIGHPILGDTLYGNSSDLINRQALHAYKVSFVHPITKNRVEYVSKIPNDMQKFINGKR